MRIEKLEIIEVGAGARGNWIFVRLHTDVGLTGLGEASQSGNDELVKAVLLQLGQRLKSRDAEQIEILWQEMARVSGIFSGEVGRVEATALSAVDQAVWDLNGKALGVPVWRLLGGRHREAVRVYANLNRGTVDRSPQGFATAAARAVDAGFSAVKSTPFDEVHYSRQDRDDVTRAVDCGVERLNVTRVAIGRQIELLVDCHRRFDLALALRVAEQVRSLNLFWFEEPVPPEQVDAMVEICRQSGHTIAGGEAFFGREAFWPYVSRTACHVAMPDVKHAGGLTECKRIASLAEVKQIPIAPHNPAGPVSTIASVHLAAATPNFLILEYPFGEVDWRDQLVCPPERIENGFIAVPELPGLGIELDEDQLAAHRV